MQVRLSDGREVNSYSLEYRDECLARHVLNIKPLGKRQEWLAGFERRHGPEEAEKLKAGMVKLWEKK